MLWRQWVLACGLVAGISCSAWAQQATTQPSFRVYSFFDITYGYEGTAGPPYPSGPPVEVAVLNPIGPGGTLIETGIIQLILHSVEPNIPTAMLGQDSGGGPGSPGIDSFFDIFTELSAPPNPIIFDVFVDIRPPRTGGPEPALGDWNVDSFFDIEYRIDFSDGSSQDHKIQWTPGPGLSLRDVHLDNVARMDSFFDIWFELTLDEPNLFDPGLPLVTMSMTGVYVPEPWTLGLLITGALAGIGRRRR